MARDQRRERLCYVCLVLLAVHLVFSSAQSLGSWWSLGVSDCGLRRKPRCDTCQELSGNGTLTPDQTSICRQQGDDMGAIRAISRGTREAIIDCQNRFEEWRWNCSTFFGQDLFGSFLNDGTRETAVVYAYMNAGAMVGIAEACHEKQILDCPCDLIGPVRVEDEDGNVIFFDCYDNVDWALTFVQNFIDNSGSSSVTPTPAGPSSRELMDKHNAQVGRKAVESRRTECNCHGISGTCTVQTCYQKVLEVEEVGEMLRTKYDGAVKVEKNDTTNELQLLATEPNAALEEQDLVFVGNSPNFCDPVMARGILGTKDRLCDPTSLAPNGCSILCCGRGHRRITYSVQDELCQFVWCCRIECSIVGNKNVTEFRCN